MAAQSELSGIIPPLLTMTDGQDRVDEPALRQSINRLIEAGVHGLFAGGSAGEGPLLTDVEWRRLMEIVLDEVGGKLPVLGGVQETSSRRTIDKINTLRDIGYTYFVVTPTFYIPIRTPEEHLRLFEACHEAAGDSMEMLPYNIPPLTQSTVAVETFCEVARRGWARYCKESSGDPAYWRRLLADAGPLGLKVLMGDERNAAEALRSGAVGLVNLCANVEPQTYVALYEAALRKDTDALTLLQARINRIIDEVALSGPCFVAGPKYVVAKAIGRKTASPVSPLQPVTAEQAAKIDAFLTVPSAVARLPSV